MEKLRIIRFISVTMLVVFFMLMSCKKFVQIPDAKNQLPSQTIFSDSADAEAAVLGMYINIMKNSTSASFLNGSNTIYCALSADELSTNTGIGDELQIYTNSIQVNNTLNSLLWSSAYYVIYQSNACIEGISSSQGISQIVKDKLVGESKIVRALCYFNLVNFYGGIPLILTTDFQGNASIPRTSPDSIYSQIFSDLHAAESLLSVEYPTAGRVRPNRLTATALLARAFLYRQMWDSAANAASRVILSGIYNLEPNLNDVFLSKSNESIWQLIPLQPGIETAEGFLFVPKNVSVKPKYSITNWLLGSFEANDLRKENWVKVNVVGGKNYYFPFKYKLGSDGNTSPVENNIVLRLGEQYLIRAEALAEKDDIAHSINDLNKIRERAGLLDTTLSTKPDLLSAIYHERQVELFCEWGHRWNDLKRLNQISNVMDSVTSLKGGVWNSAHQLFPIPVSELSSNPFLQPNPGY